MSRVPVLAALCAALVLVPSAAAKPPAPGAPGDRHTWAPADKHGFAHRPSARRATRTSTLRQASLSEIYYPDLSTPAFRGLQFAVRDGRTLQRETVDDDAAHIEPVARGVQRPGRAAPGLARVPPGRPAPGWRLTKTWITDPARPTVLADVRLESLSGRRLQLYVLADPAPGDDGDDDRGPCAAGGCSRGTTTRPPPSPRRRGCGAGRAATRGTRSDPWLRLRRGAGLKALRRPQARQRGPGRADARSTASRHRSMTLAIGFGAAPRRRGAARPAARSHAASRRAGALHGRLARLPRLAADAARAGRRRPGADAALPAVAAWCSRRRRTSATAAPRSRRRPCRGCGAR